MEVTKTDIDGILIFQPKVYEDKRGYFFESFRKEKFQEFGVDVNFVQDNESKSQSGVLRGLHFQNPPNEQGKLIRVVTGAVLDVAVDIRKGSKTYGKWISQELSEANKIMIWIPSGFAHGFLTFEDNTIFQYKCTNYYHKESEGSIFWNDTDLNIDWNIKDPIVSAKDKTAIRFKDFQSKF